MNFLEQRIKEDGRVYPGNVLSVDSFLNHQMDVSLYKEMGNEFFRRFGHEKIDKILTIEASGIGIACVAAINFGVPVLFAKKAKTSNIDESLFVSEVFSYTHHITNRVVVSKKYLHPGERILIIDDFLANGSAVHCMLDLLKQAQCIPVGIGIAVEKGFQPGGENLRKEGYHLESLAIIESMNADTGEIIFRAQEA